MTERIVQLLQRRIGMDINSVGRQSFQRVLALQLRKFDCNVEHYWLQIQHSAEMWTSLVEAVVIPETWFFRYPESFLLFARLAQQKRAETQQTLTVLCLPCSSGEEPYSLAMTLLQHGFTPAQFCIDAIDINAQILQQARAGLYRDYAFRSSDLNFREQFFSHNSDGYQLSSTVRDCVRFSCGNVLEPGSIPTQQYDFVFCRNLLIYFDQDTQLLTVRQLQRRLSKNGYLFSGPAEAGAFARAGMRALQRRDCFAFQHQPVPLPATQNPITQHLVARPAGKNGQPPPGKTQQPAGARSAFATTGTQRLQPRSSPPAPAPKTDASKTDVPTTDVSATDLLQNIEQQANAGQLSAALTLCQTALNTLGASAQLYYLWGLICDSLGQTNNAELYYRKALYIEPLHPAALSQLAALLRTQGDNAAAVLLEQRLKHKRT